jgi:predicted transcriptional regulator
MAQNKLKRKVEALTNVVRELIKEVQTNASLAQGTLTAFQLHIGKDEWNKLVEELKNVEERRVQEDKKLEIPKDVE